ncbi:hypothetical protein FB45DRAFT_1009075 [Roridomyces roridus]|uniref:Uncharacterized protein n=1 Tax=Roridomyces roridus TaxID=1738132 RepID=A0AAD7B840_9AGAR|nr:hypothetical protein FB45DRAFT_1009075 [Roridomyces roridus]
MSRSARWIDDDDTTAGAGLVHSGTASGVALESPEEEDGGICWEEPRDERQHESRAKFVIISRRANGVGDPTPYTTDKRSDRWMSSMGKKKNKNDPASSEKDPSRHLDRYRVIDADGGWREGETKAKTVKQPRAIIRSESVGSWEVGAVQKEGWWWSGASMTFLSKGSSSLRERHLASCDVVSMEETEGYVQIVRLQPAEVEIRCVENLVWGGARSDEERQTMLAWERVFSEQGQSKDSPSGRAGCSEFRLASICHGDTTSFAEETAEGPQAASNEDSLTVDCPGDTELVQELRAALAAARRSNSGTNSHDNDEEDSNQTVFRGCGLLAPPLDRQGSLPELTPDGSEAGVALRDPAPVIVQFKSSEIHRNIG